MRTSAVRDGNHYVLNGRKWLISNAGIADYYIVFASTDPEEGNRGITAFMVPADTQGLEFAGPQVMSSPHPLGELTLSDCRIDAWRRLGAEGQGFKVGMATLDRLRPTVGAAACGMASRALKEAVEHAIEREQFGTAIADFQLVQEKLGRMAIALTAARDAIQIIGGLGVLANHPVDRLYRSIRALRIYEGTTEIQHLIVGGRLVAEAREAREKRTREAEA